MTGADLPDTPDAGAPAASPARDVGPEAIDRGGVLGRRLNWLRAGVLGANDGIISTAGLVVGVAAAADGRDAVVTAGLAGLVAGAVSMALGEYVSVSAQRDAEEAMLHRERRELAEDPQAELHELADLLEARGLSPATARRAAVEMSANDTLGAHAEIELGIDPESLANPWAAAASSAVAFVVGALVPLLAIAFAPDSTRVAWTVGAVLVALAVTGSTAAMLGRAHRVRAVARVVLGGALAMIVTYLVGSLFGTAIG